MYSLQRLGNHEWRREGPGLPHHHPHEGFLRRNAKGRIEMKAFVMFAAVLASAMLTVPTVSQASVLQVNELRLHA